METKTTFQTLDMEKQFIWQFNISRECVNNTNTSTSNYKQLTLTFMDSVKNSHDVPAMCNFNRIVGEWMAEELRYYAEIHSFCVNHNDITEVYLGINNKRKELVVLVDDSTKEETVDYNDFFFDIRDKYEEIDDFMIMDDFMKDSISAMYSNRETLYTRGE